eukprot:scaffold115485_cov20-Tisochrysis_lutea.AAC.1
MSFKKGQVQMVLADWWQGPCKSIFKARKPVSKALQATKTEFACKVARRLSSKAPAIQCFNQGQSRARLHGQQQQSSHSEWLADCHPRQPRARLRG